jgi:hypothetical protein
MAYVRETTARPTDSFAADRAAGRPMGKVEGGEASVEGFGFSAEVSDEGGGCAQSNVRLSRKPSTFRQGNPERQTNGRAGGRADRQGALLLTDVRTEDDRFAVRRSPFVIFRARERDSRFDRLEMCHDSRFQHENVKTLRRFEHHCDRFPL